MFSGLNDTLVTNCYCVLLVVLWLVFRMMRGMANRPAPELVLREGDLEVLESWLRATTVPAGLARRARIVLLAA